MYLSRLQVYILRQCILSRKVVVSRSEFVGFYETVADSSLLGDHQKILTKSIERLIQKGMLIGYGHRTAEKWFIESARLTALGRRTAKRLLGEQQALPLKIRNPKH